MGSEHLAPGTILGDQYVIVGTFGSGRTTTVYKATQLNINRTVAIKFLHGAQGTLDHSRALARMVWEARAIARIEHPNVVTIYDVGLVPPDRPYIVMQPFAGHSLAQELSARGPMGFARLRALFTEALDALAVAHRQGIIHRDLRPDHLILTRSGLREALQIIDFGLVHMRDAGTRLTTVGVVEGSPRYLAPESLQGASPTPAIDVYQAGLIMIEALTGAAAIPGEDTEGYVASHQAGDVRAPAWLWGSALGPVLRKATAQDPSERFPDAGGLRDALEQLPPTALDGYQHGLREPPSGESSIALPPATTVQIQPVDSDTESVDLSATAGSPRPVPAVLARRVVLARGRIIAHRYKLVRLLGRGGHGEVWEVEHQGTRERLALKLIQAGALKSLHKLQERFELEIAALARLKHPNITQLVDEGYDEQLRCRFFVMELVRGRPFSSVGLTLGLVLDCFDQVLAALAHAHARGFIHRDLKPDNVLLQSDPIRVKITDFGMVGLRSLTSDARLTQTHALVGTLPYMSPEQASCRSENIGVASDLYAVGVMLYEALSGSRPFNGPSVMAFLFQHIQQAPPPLVLRPGFSTATSPQLEALLTDLLHKSYSARPQDAAMVRERLGAILARLHDTRRDRQDMALDPGREHGRSAPLQSPLEDTLILDLHVAEAQTSPEVGEEQTSLPHPTAEEPDGADPGGDHHPSAPMGASWRLPFLRILSPQGRLAEQEVLERFIAEIIRVRRPQLFEMVGARGLGKGHLVRWLSEQIVEQGTMRLFHLPLSQRSDLASALHLALYRFLRLPPLEDSPLRERIGESFGEAFSEDDTRHLVQFMLRHCTTDWDHRDLAAITRRCLLHMVEPAHQPARPVLLWLEGGASGEHLAAWLMEVLAHPEIATQPIGAIWSHDGAAPTPSLMAHLGAAHHALCLGPLSQAAARAIAVQLTPELSDSSLEYVLGWCQGNPLFIRELLADLWRSGALRSTSDGLAIDHDRLAGMPVQIEQVITHQLDVGLGAAEGDGGRLERALMLLALLGSSFAHGLVQGLLAEGHQGGDDFPWLSPAVLGSGSRVEALVRQGWLIKVASTREPQYALSSGALRDVLCARARATGTLDALRGDAIEWRQRAAVRAMILSDWEGAIAHLESAYSLSAQPAVPHTDRPSSSAAMDALRLDILDSLARVHYRQRDARGVAEMAAALQDTAERAEADLKARARARHTLWSAMAAWLERNRPRSSRLLHKARAQAEGVGDLALVGQALLYLGQVVMGQDHLDAAANILLQARSALADALQSKALPGSQRALLQLTEGDTIQCLAEIRSRQGAFDEARTLLLRVSARCEALGDRQGSAHAFILLTRSLRQQLEDAARPDPENLALLRLYVRELHLRIDALHDRHGRAWALAEEAYLAMLEEDFSLADALLGQAAHLLASIPDPLNEAICINSRGEACRRAGRLDEAMAHYSAFRQTMARLGHPLGEGLALINMGWTALARSDHQGAMASFNHALEALGDSAYQMRASAFVGQALAAHRAAQVDRAVACLQAAREAFAGPPALDRDLREALHELAASPSPLVAQAVRGLVTSVQQRAS